MNDAGKSTSNAPRGDNQGPPARAIFAVLTAIGLACVLGYFFLMKLVSISKQEDCMLAHRRNCAPIEIPTDR
jgi:hypothetical protein